LGSFDPAMAAMEHSAGTGFKLSVVITREHVAHLDG
jgi:hypothetical protein